MYRLVQSKQYAKSLRKLQRSGFLTSAVENDIEYVSDALVRGELLPPAFRDHQLKGEYVLYRECHIKGDLLLMYRRDEGSRVIGLMDMGTHSQLFG